MPRHKASLYPADCARRSPLRLLLEWGNIISLQMMTLNDRDRMTPTEHILIQLGRNLLYLAWTERGLVQRNGKI
jgi:hypothetical protein